MLKIKWPFCLVYNC